MTLLVPASWQMSYSGLYDGAAHLTDTGNCLYEAVLFWFLEGGPNMCVYEIATTPNKLGKLRINTIALIVELKNLWLLSTS